MRALVRKISRSLGDCELLHVPRGRIDVALAQRQHDQYVLALKANGIEVTTLPEQPELPDAVFVEDTAVILDEVGIICRPARESRLAEVESVAEIFGKIRKIHWIREPGTLEGGDILRVKKTLYVGLSTRTNAEGISQLKEIVQPFGYAVIPVPVNGCLHLKTGVTALTDDLLVANPAWIDVSAFGDRKKITVPDGEPWGANTLRIGDNVLVAASAPRTIEMLGAEGFEPHAVDISEIQKAEAGLTCLSVLFNGPRAERPG
jgi:dimethylargininase